MRLPTSSLSPSSTFTLLQGLSSSSCVSSWTTQQQQLQQQHQYLNNCICSLNPSIVQYEDLLDSNLRTLFLWSEVHEQLNVDSVDLDEANTEAVDTTDHDDPFYETMRQSKENISYPISFLLACDSVASCFDLDARQLGITFFALLETREQILSLRRQQQQQQQSHTLLHNQSMQQDKHHQTESSVNEAASTSKTPKQRHRRKQNNKRHMQSRVLKSDSQQQEQHQQTQTGSMSDREGRVVKRTRKVPRRTLLSNITDYEKDLDDEFFAELIEQVRLPTFTLEEYYEDVEQTTPTFTTTAEEEEVCSSSSSSDVSEEEEEEDDDGDAVHVGLLQEKEMNLSTLTKPSPHPPVKWKLVLAPWPVYLLWSSCSNSKNPFSFSLITFSYAAFRKRQQRTRRTTTPTTPVITSTRPPLSLRIEKVILVNMPQCPLELLQVVALDVVSHKRHDRARQRLRHFQQLLGFAPPSSPLPPQDGIPFLVESFQQVPFPHCNLQDLQVVALDELHQKMIKRKRGDSKILRIFLQTPFCALEDLKVQPFDDVLMRHQPKTTVGTRSTSFLLSLKSHTSRLQRHASRRFSGWLHTTTTGRNHRESFAATTTSSSSRASFVARRHPPSKHWQSFSLQSSLALVPLIRENAVEGASISTALPTNGAKEEAECIQRHPEQLSPSSSSSTTTVLLQRQDSQSELLDVCASNNEHTSIKNEAETLLSSTHHSNLPILQQQHNNDGGSDDNIVILGVNDNEAMVESSTDNFSILGLNDKDAMTETTTDSWSTSPQEPQPITAADSDQEGEWSAYTEQQMRGSWEDDTGHILEVDFVSEVDATLHRSASSEMKTILPDRHDTATTKWHDDVPPSAATVTALPAAISAPHTLAAHEQVVATSMPVEKEANGHVAYMSTSAGAHKGDQRSNDIDTIQQQIGLAHVHDPFTSVLEDNPENDAYDEDDKRDFVFNGCDISMDCDTRDGDILFKPSLAATSTTNDSEQRLWMGTVEEAPSNLFYEEEYDLGAIRVDLERELAAIREDLERELAAIHARLNMLRQEQLMLQMDESSDEEEEELLDENDMAILHQSCDWDVVVMNNDLGDDLEELASLNDGAELLWHLWRDPDESDELLDAEIQLLRESSSSYSTSNHHRPTKWPLHSNSRKQRNDIKPTRTRR